MQRHILRFTLQACAAGAALLAATTQAAPITWADWSSVTPGTPGSATGTLALSTPVTVGYTGSTFGLSQGISWTPNSSYADGTVVDNAPTASGGAIQLTGGDATLQTLTFSAPVLNPIVAIWSLGSGGNQARFDFVNATPVYVVGGPSAEYGGSPIVVNGNSVLGAEGNGSVQFIGSYSSLSWTNPVYEGWYAFTVGTSGVAPAVPEPQTAVMLLAGLAVLGAVARRKAA